jgi:hypothetical protein
MREVFCEKLRAEEGFLVTVYGEVWIVKREEL